MPVDRLVERLLAGSAGPGWGYGYRPSPSAEPTALGALALCAHGIDDPRVDDALDWLEHVQRSDGGVPIQASMEEPCWPTALAVLM